MLELMSGASVTVASHARPRSIDDESTVGEVTSASVTRLTLAAVSDRHRPNLSYRVPLTARLCSSRRIPTADVDARLDALHRAATADMTPGWTPCRDAVCAEGGTRLSTRSAFREAVTWRIDTVINLRSPHRTAPPPIRTMFAVSAPASALTTRPAARVVAPRRAARAVRAAAHADAPVMKGSAVTRRDAILGATATAVSLLANTGAARALDVGAAAPTFTLPATGGGTVALNDVVKANKYTVLYFYNQDFSSGCSIEAERFNQALGDFKAKGAEIVGVSMDSMVKHEEFCSAKDLRFKLLSDNDGAVSAAYGADLKIPILGKFSDRQTFLIDGAGTVKGHWLERDGSMANVKTPAHTSQILDAIDKL